MENLSEKELLILLNKNVEKLIAVTVTANKPDDEKIQILHAMGYSSNKIANILGKDDSNVRKKIRAGFKIRKK